jgi:hypothetical protein
MIQLEYRQPRPPAIHALARTRDPERIFVRGEEVCVCVCVCVCVYALIAPA